MPPPFEPTVVVDANYFRSALPAELDVLRIRGFSLRISASAFMETWARSVADDKPGIIYSACRRFGPYVSRDFPVAPSGTQLIVALGGVPPGMSRKGLWSAGETARTFRRIWADLLDEARSPTWWERAGRALKAEIDEQATRWLDLARPWREKLSSQTDAEHERMIAQIDEIGADALISSIFPYLVRTLGNPGLVNPTLRDRMNGWLRVFAYRLGQTGRAAETATANDAEDLHQLQLLGLPAFFMTNDTDILFDVGPAGTFQAPWVRRFVELAEDLLPEGVPWGASAVRAGQRFARRSRAELKALAERERLLIARLRSQATSAAP